MRKQFYTVKEATEILRRSPDRLYEDLRRGDITGSRSREGNKWLIPRSELERLGAQFEDEHYHEKEVILGAVLDSEGRLDSSTVGPKAHTITYDPNTWPWTGYAYIVDDTVKREVSVIFDPHRIVRKRL